MVKRDERPIEAYSIHGRLGEQLLDYRALFAGLASLDRLGRQVHVRDWIVAITEVREIGDEFMLRFVSGIEGETALYYDIETGEESVEETGSRIAANASWVVSSPGKRVVVIERSRPGVSVMLIERTLEELAVRAGVGNARIDLNPIPAASFVNELEELERIRSASVVLHRPNYDWADNAATLTGYAAESDGGRISVQVQADRSKSLSRTSGIVLDLKRLARSPISSLKNVKVVGNKAGESRERTVSLDRHLERRYVEVAPGTSPRSAIEEASSDLIASIELHTDDAES